MPTPTPPPPSGLRTIIGAVIVAELTAFGFLAMGLWLAPVLV